MTNPSDDMDRLKAAAERYATPNPFKVGELVTPITGGMMTNQGRPHIVIEVLKEPYRDTAPQAGAPVFLCLYDLRVASIDRDGYLVTHAVESAQMEYYPRLNASS